MSFTDAIKHLGMLEEHLNKLKLQITRVMDRNFQAFLLFSQNPAWLNAPVSP